jgi:hypothetical protein
MDKYIWGLLEAGFIRSSTASFAPPLHPAGAGFFVGEKDGGQHPCIDYRGQNRITNKTLTQISELALGPSTSPN